jgi:hypothetical protein
MNLPMQAAPVMRGSARAYQTQTVTQQQSCDWLQCASKLLSCAESCFPNPLNPGCISCLGPLWDTCKSCF